MDSLGRILIVDDEESILLVLSNFLTEHGYKIDCADNVKKALIMLQENKYDLLISDLHMPGNENLEFIKSVEKFSSILPVILITAYPTTDSAISSIELPIESYMVKPVPLAKLLDKVKSAIKKTKLNQNVKSLRINLDNWRKELADMETVLHGASEYSTSIQVNDILDLTYKNIINSLSTTRKLLKVTSLQDNGRMEVCTLLDCPKLKKFSDAIMETILTLEKTKRSFKSKELGSLRAKLENVLKETSPEMRVSYKK